MSCQVSPRKECDRRLAAAACILLPRPCREMTLRNWSAEISRGARAVLTHHVHILSMNGESYRLTQSARYRKLAVTDADDQSAVEAIDPDTGEIDAATRLNFRHWVAGSPYNLSVFSACPAIVPPHNLD